ncbi:MAG: hypothetical protein ACE5JD_15125 [Candidatus Methylomirabilia bacterium]
MEEEPLVTVVLTYTAAKTLEECLDQVFPQTEQGRREGRTCC